MNLPPFLIPTWSNLFPSNWLLVLVICFVVVAATIGMLMMFWLVPKPIRRIVIHPIVEETAFRLILLWWLLRAWLHMDLLGAFWWCLIAFVVPHVFDAIADADLGRILDAVNIGAFNSILFPLAIFELHFPVWTVLICCILVHVAYNAVVVGLKLLPLVGCLVGIVRIICLLLAAGVYWFGLNRLAIYWPG